MRARPRPTLRRRSRPTGARSRGPTRRPWPVRTPADSGGADASPSFPATSDPVTTAVSAPAGSKTYEVGPGKAYEEPDTVPWGALAEGDVVNIYFRAAPYRWKLCLRGQGTQQKPIVVNGVTDATGQRPKFDFNGARTASGCNPGGGDDVFNTASEWSLEDYAGIVIRAGVSDDWGTKPKWLQIKNLELTGAAPGNSFTNLLGQNTPYVDSPAGIWIQPSADVLVENCVIYDHAFGVFTMAKNGSLDEACERITLRNNRIWGNGRDGSYYEHNVYMQSTNPIVEGNYFGPTRPLSEGSTYKSRSSGEIFRYNYVEASARAVDWVYSEDQTPGIATQADYGTDFAYGNVIVNDCALGKCASQPIHYGGDNLGEQEDEATEFVPDTPYRSHLYFFNNTVVNRTTTQDAWRAFVFDLSLRTTTVDAWNNVFSFTGDTNFSWVQSAGRLNLAGTNLFFGADVADARDTALAVNYTVTKGAALKNLDPKFVSATDLHPGAGSAALDQATGLPAGIAPPSAYVQVPVSMEPSLKANGMTARTQKGAALDLGAFEAP
ncbi:MAG: right-handed parallel beta-helix repeat-containing protein [Myxococcales bacterium]